MTELFVSFLTSNPLFALVLTVIGALRLVIKPIMTALHIITQSTATPVDDKMLNDLEHSKMYQALMFALDWLTSIKLPR